MRAKESDVSAPLAEDAPVDTLLPVGGMACPVH